MITLRSSRIAFVGILFALSASSVSAMSCAIDANGKTTCPTSEQVDELRRVSEPVACTMDAKMCPDGSYVGRVAPHCEFAACPGVDSCAPYKCVDGTEVARCTSDGTVINYFAEPCLTHGGEAGSFKDVPANHANAQAIAYVQSQGIVEGYADGTYRPDQTINRAEFVKILVNAQFPSSVSACMLGHGGAASFLMDLDTEAWYAKHVCVAFDRQIIQGYPDGTFRPSTTLNFAEAAKIISLSFEIAAPGIAAHEPWYAPFVRDLERYNAIPLSITSFDQKITRGEMAEMVWRLKAKVTDLPSQTFDSISSLANLAKRDGSSVSSCADAFRATGMCPQDRCVMDCADRDNPPKDGLGCPPGCFEK